MAFHFGGWEEGDTSATIFASGSPSVVTSPVHLVNGKGGEYSLRSNPVAGKKYDIEYISLTGAGAGAAGSLTTCYIVVHIYVTTLPSANVDICSTLNAALSGACVQLKLSNTGALTLVGSTTSSTIATLTTGQWYRIEVKAVQNGTCEAKVNGGTVQTCTGNNTDISYMVFGNNINNGTFDINYDDWAISSTGYVGSIIVTRLDPAGNGNYTAWTNDFNNVNEVPHNSDTDFITSATNGQAETVTFEAHGSAGAAGIDGTVYAVMAWATVRDEGGSSGVAVRIRSGGTDFTSSFADPGSTYVVRRQVAVKDLDGSMWTPEKLDDLEVGVVLNASAAVRCTAIYAMALIAPALATSKVLVFDGTKMKTSTGLLMAVDPTIWADRTDGHYRMVFASTKSLGAGIEFYEATLPVGEGLNVDPSHWTISGTTLFSRPGTGFDSLGIETPAYVYGFDATAGQFVERLYYTAYASALATTGGADMVISFAEWNGSAWVRHGSAVITATELWEESASGFDMLFEPAVYYDTNGSLWHMYYTAGDGLFLAHATSADGITWSNKTQLYTPTSVAWGPSNPIAVVNHFEMSTATIDGLGLANPGLYRGRAATLSGDGADWDFTDYIVNRADGTGWHNNSIHGASLHYSGNDLIIYFSAKDDSNGSDHPHIGMAIVKRISPDGAITLPSLTGNSAAVMQPDASGVVTLPSLIASASATFTPATPSATVTVDLPSLSASSNVVESQEATANNILPSFIAASSAIQKPEATASVILPSLIAAQTAIEEQIASVGTTLPSFTSSSVAIQIPSATSANTLPSLTASGTVIETEPAASSVSLPSLTSNGAAVMQPSATSTVSLPSLIGNISATEIESASGAVILPSMNAVAATVEQPSATVNISLPSLTAASVAVFGSAPTAFIAANLPSLSNDSASALKEIAVANVSLPSLNAIAASVQQPEALIIVSLPALFSNSIVVEKETSTSGVILPSLSASVSGTVSSVQFTADSSVNLPSLLSSSSTAVQPIAVIVTSLPSLFMVAVVTMTEPPEAVVPITSGYVELEDLIDRNTWPDNIEPSQYTKIVEEPEPSGFIKQPNGTELWNL